MPETVVTIPGATGIEILRYADPEATYVPYDVPAKYTPMEDVKAHWLEALGLGVAGNARSYDLWNPFDDEVLSPADQLKEFQFFKVIIYRNDDDYHAQLKSWLVAQRTVYNAILAELVNKGLITPAEAAKPMRIRVEGIDERTPSAHANVTFVDAPPWGDLLPPNTEVSWKGLQ